MTLHKWFYLIGMTTQHFHYVRTIYISIKQISVNHHDPALTEAWYLMQRNVSRFYTIICNFLRQKDYKPTYNFIKYFRKLIRWNIFLVGSSYLVKYGTLFLFTMNNRKKVQYWNYYQSLNYLLVDLLLFQLMLKFLGREWKFFPTAALMLFHVSRNDSRFS